MQVLQLLRKIQSQVNPLTLLIFLAPRTQWMNQSLGLLKDKRKTQSKFKSKATAGEQGGSDANNDYNRPENIIIQIYKYE